MSYQLRYSADKADSILDKIVRLKIRIEQLVAEQQGELEVTSKKKMLQKKSEFINDLNNEQNDLISTHEEMKDMQEQLKNLTNNLYKRSL